jgi:hypothetical protein
MARRTRLKYTDEMRSYIWDRYQLGDSVKSIGRFFDRPSSSIHKQLARTGGIRPRERKRSSQVLSLVECAALFRSNAVSCRIATLAIHFSVHAHLFPLALKLEIYVLQMQYGSSHRIHSFQRNRNLLTPAFYF